MSEKQFKVLAGGFDEEGNPLYLIKDTTDMNRDMIGDYEICKKVIEQQSTIEEQNKEIEDWEFSFRTEMAHHRFAEKELQEKIREKQATIEEYEDFCLNLCKFLIGKGLVDEYREEYGKEYKIITKWKGCGSDE